MRNKILLPVFIFLYLVPRAQTIHKFEIKNGNFYYDEKVIQIHSGEMHYARIPKEYWRHRLKMIRALGLNTVATYVFWNYHNTAPGAWDFTSGNKDLAEFIRTAKEEGLWVILRPGPYACAEWEFGGYPWWLQKDSNLVIRTYNKPFLDSCKVYINKLAQQVKDLQVTKGGNLIMVQVENEFGSYVAQRKDIPDEQHKKYNRAIKQLLLDAGFNVPFFTSDGSWLFGEGSMEGILPTANGEGNIDSLKSRVNRYHNGEGPYMVAEYYPGWLHHWGEPFPHITTESVVDQLETYLKNGVSFNIYMVHGGTNFGFTSGANYDKEHDIQPDLTTYDYDAPISEPGWATPKYMAIRELMKKYVTVAEIPAPMPVIKISPIQLTRSVDLFSMKEKFGSVKASQPLSFEDLGQGSGYVLYSRKIDKAIKGLLQVNGLRDYAVVYVNKKKVGVLNRIDKVYTVPVDLPAKATLEIWVENMGRINYGAAIIHNKKGIISSVMIDNVEVRGKWEMYKFPFEKMPVWENGVAAKNNMPALYEGVFDLDKTGDVFLDMHSWGKGIVFVNGHNIGRYWNIGPQQTLYLPGCWLLKGKNKIVVFEQLNDNIEQVISSVDEPVLKDLKIKTGNN